MLVCVPTTSCPSLTPLSLNYNNLTPPSLSFTPLSLTVTDMMGKNTAEHYTVLHRVLYGKPGTLQNRKKNVRRFNGFPFDWESPEHEAKLRIVK